MNLFLDANIIVSVLNKEYPLFPFTSRILSLSDTKKFHLFTSPICLAISFYFAEKRHGTKQAKQKIGILCEHLGIIKSAEIHVRKTLANPAINDFEDGLEYYAAAEQHCKCIITENIEDFYFSEIEVLDSKAFIQKYFGK